MNANKHFSTPKRNKIHHAEAIAQIESHPNKPTFVQLALKVAQKEH